MADKPLTPKMQGFVDGRAEGMTQSDAYRAAYNTKNMTPKQIWEEASKLAALPKVAQRLFELQEASAERTLVTMESITAELEEARVLGKKTEQSSAMTAASMGKAKVNGLLVDKVDTKGEVKIVMAKDVDEL
jgi:hypothetical protein